MTDNEVAQQGEQNKRKREDEGTEPKDEEELAPKRHQALPAKESQAGHGVNVQLPVADAIPALDEGIGLINPEPCAEALPVAAPADAVVAGGLAPEVLLSQDPGAAGAETVVQPIGDAVAAAAAAADDATTLANAAAAAVAAAAPPAAAATAETVPAPALAPPDSPPPPCKQYNDAKKSLQARMEAVAPLPAATTPAASTSTSASTDWHGFTDYLGEGARSRLTAVAALHLTEAGVARCPEALRKLPANCNRVLLGAAPNCELYQERVIRALAAQAGARLLVADAEALLLDDLPSSGASASGAGAEGAGEDAGMGGMLGDLGDAGLLGGSGYNSTDEGDDLDDMDLGMGNAGRGAFTVRRGVPPRRGAGGRPAPVSFTAALNDAEEMNQRLCREALKLLKESEEGGKEKEKEDAAAAAAAAVKEEGAEKGVEAKPAAPKTGDDVAQPMEASPAKAPEGGVEAIPDGGGAPGTAASAIVQQPAGSAAPAQNGEKEKAAEGETAPAAAAAEKPETAAAAAPAQAPANEEALSKRVSHGRERVMSLIRSIQRSRAVLHKVEGRLGVGDAADGAKQPATFKPGDRVVYQGPNGGGPGAGGVPSLLDLDRLPLLSSFMTPDELRGKRGGGASASARMNAALKEMARARRGAATAGEVHWTSAAAGAAAAVNADTPVPGSRGRVVSVSAGGDRVEVAMDDPFTGGKTLTGQRAGCGLSCSAAEISPLDDRADAWSSSFSALFDLIAEEAPKGPLVVFLPGVDKLVRTNARDQFNRLRTLLQALPQRCLLVAAYCSRALSKERASSGPSGLSMLFGGGRGAGESLGIGGAEDFPSSWYERLGGGGRSSSRSRATNKGRVLASMLPNTVELHPPHCDSAAKAWKRMLDADVAAMRERANRTALGRAMAKCDVECADLEAMKVSELALSRKDVQVVVGAAAAAALQAEVPAAAAMEASPAAAVAGCKLQVTAEQLVAAAASVKLMRSEAVPVPERSALKDLQTDQYEKQLLNEVIPPEEISVGFDDIGALESVKETLQEVVILPLQRPELFARGALTRPTKGLLLFGPPGTGKTMLAKAVASESGAHFINVNMSAISSKWLGEGEKLVRALFSLAHKLAPSVIFVDEIDAFLSRRGGTSHEHEAIRKLKTEWFQHWDGLRTKATDRVLVLAATNRPMDLDDAAVRRMPRRLLVPLPDAAQREKILQVILKDESVDPKLDVAELARMTDGYSGSDIKNLCIAAAYCPLREMLQAERAAKAAAAGNEADAAAAAVAEYAIRAMSLKDFAAAMKQVTPSTHPDSASSSELQRWNDQFGEGGSRKAEQLVYFT